LGERISGWQVGLGVLGALGVTAWAPTWAGDAPAAPRTKALTVIDTCLQVAAARHGVAEPLLRAIAMQESGLRPDAINHNRNGTRDLGLMQVNTSWLPELARYGVTEKSLMNPCTSADVGAWILARSLQEHGNNWHAVGRYHSATDGLNQRYAWAVYRRLAAAAPQSPTLR
jgi:soluble lytic murein transglycosylase-like protein